MALHFSANLTTELRQFLERWGWNFSEQGGIFPPVKQDIIPVINLGDFAAVGAAGAPLLPTYSVRINSAGVAALRSISLLLCGANQITLLGVNASGAAQNLFMAFSTLDPRTADQAAGNTPAGLTRGDALTATTEIGTQAGAPGDPFVFAQGVGLSTGGLGGSGALKGFRMQEGERLICIGTTVNTLVSLDVIFQETPA